jgi:hypothetical protein
VSFQRWFQADLSDYKRLVYVVLLVVYGSLALPSAALKGYTVGYFDACAALYATFSIMGFISVAWQNIFVPIIMRAAAPVETTTIHDPEHSVSPHVDLTALQKKRNKAGLTTSAWGLAAMNGGAALVFIITIALTYANEEAALYGGLSMSTATAAACIVMSLSAGPFLPRADKVDVPKASTFWKLPFTTCTSFSRSGPLLVG